MLCRDSNTPIPPCTGDLTATNATPNTVAEASDGGSSDADGQGAAALPPPTTAAGVSRSPSERLLAACRDYSSAYVELQEKYHELIYSNTEKLVRASQANQLKQLKTQQEKETSDMMRQLNVTRRTEVKALAVRHKDRDELVR